MPTPSLSNVRPGAPDNTFNWLVHFGQPGPTGETFAPLYLGDGTELPLAISNAGVRVNGLLDATVLGSLKAADPETGGIFRFYHGDYPEAFESGDDIALMVRRQSGTMALLADIPNPVTVSGNGLVLAGQQISLSIGTGATQVAAGNHTHVQLHDPVTVSGNGLVLSGQNIHLAIGTGATQVAAGNHTHTAADVGAVGTTGSVTVGTESVANVGILKRLSSFTPVLAGTAAASVQSGDDYALFSGTSGGGYSRFVLARNLTAQGAYGSPTLDCAKNFDLALSVAALLPDTNQVARLLFGAQAAPVAGDVAQSLTGKGWGVELRRSAVSSANVEFRLVAFDSAWAISSAPLVVSNNGDAIILLRKEGNLAKLWKAPGRTAAVDTTAVADLTLSGAPSTGPAASVICVAEIANASSPPSSGGSFRMTSPPIIRIWS